MQNDEVNQQNSQLIIGYYPIRGKAQIIRLICEYLHINYRNKFMCQVTW